MSDFIIDGDGLTLEELRTSMENMFNREKDDCVEISGKEKYNLTEDETLYLVSFTGSGSKWINPSLKNEVWLKDRNKVHFIKMIDSALQKITPINSTTVFHMASSMLTKSIDNTTFLVKSYLSTSIDNFENSDFIWEIITKEKNSNARDISTITGNKCEKEILFMRNTEFRIKNTEKKNNVTYYSLIEI